MLRKPAANCSNDEEGDDTMDVECEGDEEESGVHNINHIKSIYV